MVAAFSSCGIAPPGRRQSLPLLVFQIEYSILQFRNGRIATRAPCATEFAAVTDIPLLREHERHRFLRHPLRGAGTQPVAMKDLRCGWPSGSRCRK